jgi:hypothetical protein
MMIRPSHRTHVALTSTNPKIRPGRAVRQLSQEHAWRIPCRPTSPAGFSQLGLIAVRKAERSISAKVARGDGVHRKPTALIRDTAGDMLGDHIAQGRGEIQKEIQGAVHMRNYSNTGGRGTADWLWATVKDNPDGLLLLAAGCALLLRKGRSIQRTERDRNDAQEYLGGDIPHQGRADDWTNEASGMADNARDQVASMSKKMSETAADYAASVSEYARGTQEQVVEQSRRLAEKAQNRVQSLMQHQPLAVALVGLAAGAAVAAAFPTTVSERRVLGPARQRLYEAAEAAGQQITETAGERVMGAVKERVKDVVREVSSGTAGGEKDPPEQATPSPTAPEATGV